MKRSAETRVHGRAVTSSQRHRGAWPSWGYDRGAWDDGLWRWANCPPSSATCNFYGAGFWSSCRERSPPPGTAGQPGKFRIMRELRPRFNPVQTPSQVFDTATPFPAVSAGAIVDTDGAAGDERIDAVCMASSALLGHLVRELLEPGRGTGVGEVKAGLLGDHQADEQSEQALTRADGRGRVAARGLPPPAMKTRSGTSGWLLCESCSETWENA